jgi:hypothetical protein
MLLGSSMSSSRGALHQRTRDGDRLALPARQPLAALAHFGGETLRQLLQGFLETGEAHRFEQLRVIDIGRAEQDVFLDVAMEQRDVLRHVAELTTQAQGIHLPHRHAVDHDRALHGA